MLPEVFSYCNASVSSRRLHSISSIFHTISDWICFRIRYFNQPSFCIKTGKTWRLFCVCMCAFQEMHWRRVSRVTLSLFPVWWPPLQRLAWRPAWSWPGNAKAAWRSECVIALPLTKSECKFGLVIAFSIRLKISHLVFPPSWFFRMGAEWQVSTVRLVCLNHWATLFPGKQNPHQCWMKT